MSYAYPERDSRTRVLAPSAFAPEAWTSENAGNRGRPHRAAGRDSQKLTCQRYSRPSGGNHRTTSRVSRAGSPPLRLARTASPGRMREGELTRTDELPAMLTLTPRSSSELVLTRR